MQEGEEANGRRKGDEGIEDAQRTGSSFRKISEMIK
jgi:hypothetical protein